jgi:integrase
MRHTFATLALGAGAAIDDVASTMGHTDIDEVYRFYRKWIPQSRERLRAVLNTIGKENDAALDRVLPRT